MRTATVGAAVSHVGRVRSNNQDSGYAGTNLFLVADGMGGHAGGDVASSIATRRIAQTDRLDFATPQEAEFALQSAMVDANRELGRAVLERSELMGMGTTASALIRVGDVVATAHIGDSRIYLQRGGELSQITNDHTFVQRLVETGRITPEEAAVHPRRSVLMRVLGDVDHAPEIDTSVIATLPGDRWILCSDGLSSYVPEEEIHAVLNGAEDARRAAGALVGAALEHGAPDNVTVIVVDIDRSGGTSEGPQLVGAAANDPDPELATPGRQHNRLPAVLLHPMRTAAPERFHPDSEDYLDALIREDRRRVWRRRITWLAVVALVLVGVVVGAVVGYRYTQTQYYVGFDGDRVAIYQGVHASLGPIPLSHVVVPTGISRGALSPYAAGRLDDTIPADSLQDARRIVDDARQDSRG
ncbi:PP2C family protein-serine/threonine phosphatase [Amnibacterium endophyticum]|uniref:PP2C family protein-serine/threonine phosphatase n=1 Tax=Amnibacterium endophyticum TaxID=2109337 RepID=A0ABW4LDM2_9MICO